jgi:hypothetical protein
VEIIAEFRRVSSAASVALAAFRNSTVSTQASSLARQAKARHGETGRALEEDKGWDPLLLFPRGVWTEITLQKIRNRTDHKQACAHHNPVRDRR